jgi:HSP20 family protein
MTLYINTPYGRMVRRWMDREIPGKPVDVVFPIDVKSDDEAYVVVAMLPGVKSEDLDIKVVNDVVSLQGEIHNSHNDAEHYLLSELPNGHFSRSLTLPEELNPDGAEASLENGVLTLRVPKAEQARPRTIKVISKN